MSPLSARIRAKCVDDGGCLVWDGRITPGGTPMMKHNGRCSTVRRVLWEEENGPVPPNKVIACTCETRGCVLHIEPQTFSKVAKRAGKNGAYTNPVRCAKIAATKRKTSSLTQEQVNDIRYGAGSAMAAAARHGVTPGLAAAIRRGERWKEYGGHFAGLGARP